MRCVCLKFPKFLNLNFVTLIFFNSFFNVLVNLNLFYLEKFRIRYLFGRSFLTVPGTKMINF